VHEIGFTGKSRRSLRASRFKARSNSQGDRIQREQFHREIEGDQKIRENPHREIITGRSEVQGAGLQAHQELRGNRSTCTKGSSQGDEEIFLLNGVDFSLVS
jgi:hypothetical protein